ncbi:MAG: protein kinase, partial [Myxococcota bacterium]
MDIQAGTRIERYVVEGLIGMGGMARVYRVRHTQLRSLHALKVLQIPTPAVVDRLLQEGRAQSALNHPNIVSVTDVLNVWGSPGLLMEWIDGPSLKDILAVRPLTLPEADALLQGILAGVAEAHAHELVHRDLKPGNILLQRRRGHLTPKITDFGLVKALSGDLSDRSHTRSGVMMGTPAYMAPEQITDAGKVDHRADVFAVGVLMYEMITGQRPWPDVDAWARVHQLHALTVRSPRERCPNLSVDQEAAILGALHVDPNARLQSVDALWQRWGVTPASVEPMKWTEAQFSGLPRLNITPILNIEDETITMDGVTEEPHPFTPTPPTVSIPTPPTASVETAAVPLSDVVSKTHATLDAPPQSRRPWGVVGSTALAVAVAVAVAVAGAGAWAWMTPTSPDVLTVDATPIISDDARTQEQFERAWFAFLDGDREDALRRLRLVVTQAPDAPLAEQVLSYVLMRDGQVTGSLEIMRDFDRKWGLLDGPLGSLVGVIRAQQKAGTTAVPEVAAHQQAYPEDLLGAMLAADHCAQHSVAFCEARVTELLALAPEAPMIWQIIVETWFEANQIDRAEQAITRGLEIAPTDPTLLIQASSLALQQQDLDRAAVLIQDALKAAPSALDARLTQAQVAILRGDEQTLSDLQATLTSPSQPVDTRVRFWRAVAQTRRGLGHSDRWEDALLKIQEIESTDGTLMGVYMALVGRSSRTYVLGDLDATAAIYEEIGDLVNQSPEMSTVFRTRIAIYNIGLEGIRILRDEQDIEQASALLARIQAVRASENTIPERLAREIAVARKDADAIIAL